MYKFSTFFSIIIINVLLSLSCNSQNVHKKYTITQTTNVVNTDYKTINIMVALCDNTYQGIVPVPAKIGNGQDPNNNLYWGCAFGYKTFFKNSKNWSFIKSIIKDSTVLETLIFKHKTQKYYLVIDAYNGKEIKKCIDNFIKSLCGEYKNTIQINNTTIGTNGNASLIAYAGHNGLMDFVLPNNYINKDSITRNTIILACYSKKYFRHYLANTNINALVWSNGFMSPEAYTMHDAIDMYIAKQNPEQIAEAASKAYCKYQKCSIKAARNLLDFGF